MHGRVERAPDKVVRWWQRLFGLHRQGRLIIFEEVDWPAARESFDKFLESPKEFAIETVEGVRIDFSAKHGKSKAGDLGWSADESLGREFQSWGTSGVSGLSCELMAVTELSYS